MQGCETEIWIWNQERMTVGEATRISGSWRMSVSRLSGNNNMNWGTHYSSQEKKKGKTKGRGKREWGPDSFPNSFPVFSYSFHSSLFLSSHWPTDLGVFCCCICHLYMPLDTQSIDFFFLSTFCLAPCSVAYTMRTKPWKVAWNWRERVKAVAKCKCWTGHWKKPYSLPTKTLSHTCPPHCRRLISWKEFMVLQRGNCELWQISAKNLQGQ